MMTLPGIPVLLSPATVHINEGWYTKEQLEAILRTFPMLDKYSIHAADAVKQEKR
jgi:hypothetical protein